jgi:hypothetical protein
MDSDLARYIVQHYCDLMSSTERRAERHLTTTYKSCDGRSDAAAQLELLRAGGPRSRWLSDDPAVLALAANGFEAFCARAAARILAEHGESVFLNCCPECGKLTRTPKARLCLHCGHAWHHATAV